MKKLIAMVALSAAVAGVALAARPQPKPHPSDAEVQAAIDARLHELLKKLNDQHH
ncbi:MAG: hypothetical protein IT380_25830 [Myxococcales bacterium]|nr:hypothetical protein [Myxococcales bacterium]